MMFFCFVLSSVAVTNLHAKGPDVAHSKGNGAETGQVTPYRTVSYDKAGPDKMKWWEDAKFGLFVHWGVYAVPAGLWSKDNTFESWHKEYQDRANYSSDNPNLVNPANYSERLLHKTNMRLSEYERLPALFDWSKFNAQDFIDLCFASGQRYIVITSKHHDGFAMWRSKVDEWDVGDATPYGRESGRDPLKELADACQATKTNGSPWEIKMCFYHSHCVDWHEDGAFTFDYKWQKDTTPERFQQYLARKVKPQLTELLTGYGDISLIWFDVPRMISKEQAIDLREFVNKLNPNTICDGRLGQDQGNYVNCGDNGSVGTVVDFPWETGSSINESFGYHCMDHEHKSPEWIVNKLIDVSAHGGNYLLNIGPKPDGSISDEDRKTLSAVGKWTKANGEAIFGTRASPYAGDRSFNPDWGECTQKGGNLYLIVQRWPKDGKVVVPLLKNRIKRIAFVTDPERKALPYERAKDPNGNDLVVIGVPDAPLDRVATCIAVECEGDALELAPFRHAYDASKKQTYLGAANFQAHASNVKDLSLRFDRDETAIVNWRHNKGRGATVAWTCEVPEAGEYVVEIDYSLQRPHAGLPVDVLVEGKKQLTFTTEETGGYDKYKRVAVGAVKLEARRQDLAFNLSKSDVSRLYVMQLRGVYLTKKSHIGRLSAAAEEPMNVLMLNPTDGYRDRVDAMFQAEAGQMLKRAKKEPPLRPGSGDFTRAYSLSMVGFAARCSYLGEMPDEANAALVENAQYYLDNPKDIIDRDSFHWHADIVMRLIEMYGPHGTVHAGRLTAETEALCLKPIWIYVKTSAKHNKPDHATTKTWHFHSTENHHAMDFSVQWHFAKLAKDRPEYRELKLDDGTSLDDLYRAWSEYIVVYCRERAKKGVCIEIMCPGYNAVWLKGFYNFRDFGTPEVRRSAGMLLDLYWAYWAQEQLHGVEGGGKARIRGVWGFKHVVHGIPALGWFYFGIGEKPKEGSAEINALLSDYEPPAVVAEIARSARTDGPYEVRQRAQGLGEQGFGGAVMSDDAKPNKFRTDGGGIVRYSYCDPAFTIGTLLTEARPPEDWVGISSQSRWQGVIFADNPAARIVPVVRPGGKGRDVVNGHWSVQSKGSLVTQKLKGKKVGGPMIVWMPRDGMREPVRDGDLVFVETDGAYAAIRVVGGKFELTEMEVSTPSIKGSVRVAPPGRVVLPEDDTSPVILEVMARKDLKGFEDFKAKVKANQPEMKGALLVYKTIYGDRLTFDTSQIQTPTINGKPVDYAPPKVLESPFLNADYDKGVITIQKGEQKKILDFTQLK